MTYIEILNITAGGGLNPIAIPFGIFLISLLIFSLYLIFKPKIPEGKKK